MRKRTRYEVLMPQPAEKQRQIMPTEEAHEWSDWVEKAKGGNRPAFERLIELFQEDIFRMVYYRTRSKMDAEDLTQEIFIKAFNGLAGLQENKRFKSWLFSIAVNRVRDFHRKKKLQQVFHVFPDHGRELQKKTETDQDPEALEDLIKQDFWNHVESFLKKLSKTEKDELGH